MTWGHWIFYCRIGAAQKDSSKYMVVIIPSKPVPPVTTWAEQMWIRYKHGIHSRFLHSTLHFWPYALIKYQVVNNKLVINEHRQESCRHKQNLSGCSHLPENKRHLKKLKMV